MEKLIFEMDRWLERLNGFEFETAGRDQIDGQNLHSVMGAGDGG